MTNENMIKVIQAKTEHKCQICCRAVAGALDSWYITLVDPKDWNWSFNEYRIYQGVDEPPMTDKMNDYTVYFCGYTYYFIDTEDKKVKKITNVNFTQNGAQYTSFLRCHEIETDLIKANETGIVSIEDATSIDGDFTVTGDVRTKKYFASEEIFGQSKGIPFGTFGDGITEGRLYANGVAFVSPGTDAAWIRHYDSSTNQGVLELAVGDNTNETIVCKQYNTSGQVAREITLLNSVGNTNLYTLNAADEINLRGRSILDSVYPIGSIYMSVNNVSPNTFIGGKWEQIKDTFLLTAGDTYKAGATGGEATHKLTKDEMPSHSHTFNGSTVTTGTESSGHTHSFTTEGMNSNVTHRHEVTDDNNSPMEDSGRGSGSYSAPGSGGGCWQWTEYANIEHTHSGTTNKESTTHTHSVTTSGSNSNTGGSGAHNNMPPYLAVYCWKRIS